MLRRTFLSTVAGAAFAQSGQPNIVVILADDLGWGDVRCYNPEARTQTPRMDGLAREGVRFTDAHSPSSVCTPTRYGLLTGRYCWRSRLKSGVLNGESPSLLEPGRVTIASMLKQRGYRTGGFGKWHLGLGDAEKTNYAAELTPGPNDFGFDEFFGIPASLDMPPYLYFENRRALEQPTSQIETNGAPPRGPFWRGGAIAPGFRMDDVLPNITERACRFIADSARRPFFAYVPMNGPHTPWVPSADWKGKSKAGLYGDFVEQIDASVGRIVDQLETSGVAKRTFVVVTSDNGAPWSEPDIATSGGHRANASWRGQKADIQEAGHRIPFLVRWPGRAKAGKISTQTVCLTDLFATVAAVVGGSLGPGMAEDSFNLLPAVIGKSGSRPIRESIVHHSQTGLFSIRQGKWKLIEGRGSGGFTKPQKIDPAPGEPQGELYNLETDPREDRNLYAERPEKVSELAALLGRLRAQGHSRPM